MERLESWFGSHSQDWTEAYRVASRVNDHVLVDRLRIALTFARRDVPPGGQILDAGCGAGWASLELARSGYSVHGVDLAQEMIDQAERTFVQEGLPGDAYRFTRGDVTQLDLAPESFDGIIALGVLQYQVEEALLLQRFHELLRPGGTLVVTGPIERSIPNFFGVAGTAGSTLRRMRVLRSRPRTGRTLHRYSVTRLRRLLQAAGYEVVEQKGHGFGDWAVIGRVIGYRGELALHRFFSWAATFTPVGRWGNDLVLVARRSAE
jgi:2-polyprenyl-3-methyl-5-hydroxy-6-metoxy-1,4-benzoquinol methylase